MDSRAVIALIEADGWTRKAVRGSHHQFAHPSRPGKVTVPHPGRHIPIGTLKAIERQSGVILVRRNT